MNPSYSQELRADTSRIVIPIMTLAVLLVSLIFVVSSASFWDVSHFWFSVIIGPLGGWLAWQLIKQERYNLGIAVFFAAQYTILAVILYQEWQPGSPIPYLFGVLIVASAMLSRAENSFLAWGAATILILGIVFWKEGPSFNTFLLLLGPVLVNLALASVAFLSAVEWQYAVETVSDLHRNVQRRRDDLFMVQEEIKFANAKLEFSNSQLAKATQAALEERDIRTRFMNHVSHELRTPLNSIVNFAHIVRLGGRGPVSEGQIDYLERIEKSGWHLLSVLNDLLDMAQIQAGEFKLHLEVCDLQALCEEAMTTMRGLLLEGDVDLVRDYPDEWPLVKVDKMRVKQSLINLLGNAVKYTEEGLITLRVQQIDEELHLSVIDTGIGISPEHHETIFMEFRQVNESAARKRVGTGLGLPITRHLIERHGGQMFVTSEPGEGSCFTIVLPVYEEGRDLVPVVAVSAVAATAVAATAVPATGADELVLAGAVASAVASASALVVSTAVPDPPPTTAWAKQQPEDNPIAREQPPMQRRQWGYAVLAVLLLIAFGWLLFTRLGGEGEDGTPAQIAAVAALGETPSPTASSEPTAVPTPEPPPTVVALETAESTAVTVESTATVKADPTETATADPTSTNTPTTTPTATASPSPTPSPTAVPTESPVPPVSNSAAALLSSSLYRQADAASEEVTFVNAGDTVTVVGRSANSNWLYVRTADGLEGFVFGERLEWSGDPETVPVVNGSNTTPPVSSGPLALDLYLLANTGRCEGQTWWQTVYMRGQGGNGRYTYYWNGDQIASDVANDGVSIEMSFTGGAQSGVGEVVSGGVSVSKTLFIPPPGCN